MNATETPEQPEHPDDAEQAPTPPERAEHAPPTAAEETSTTAEAAEGTTEEAEDEAGHTSLFVRRGRTPTLGFWAALAIGVPTVAGLVLAPLLGITTLSAIVQFALMAAVFVGLPLAALAAAVDALRHR